MGGGGLSPKLLGGAPSPCWPEAPWDLRLPRLELPLANHTLELKTALGCEQVASFTVQEGLPCIPSVLVRPRGRPWSFASSPAPSEPRTHRGCGHTARTVLLSVGLSFSPCKWHSAAPAPRPFWLWQLSVLWEQPVPQIIGSWAVAYEGGFEATRATPCQGPGEGEWGPHPAPASKADSLGSQT